MTYLQPSHTQDLPGDIIFIVIRTSSCSLSHFYTSSRVAGNKGAVSTSGVRSPGPSSSLRPLPRTRFHPDCSLPNTRADQVGWTTFSPTGGATGVIVVPCTTSPGGSVTSARHVGHWDKLLVYIMPVNNAKPTSFLHFNNHSSHSSLWKTCPQGKIRTTSPRWNESMQMAHSSLLKYFFPWLMPDFERFFLLGPEAHGWSSSCTAGGVVTSEGLMGGGGGMVVGAADVGEAGRGDDCLLGRLEREGARDAVSESESFSQTISGDQIRSGRDKTRRGGARSASRCLCK